MMSSFRVTVAGAAIIGTGYLLTVASSATAAAAPESIVTTCNPGPQLCIGAESSRPIPPPPARSSVA